MLSCRAGGGGGVGGKLSRPFYHAQPAWVSKQNYFANSSYFNLSDCEDGWGSR